MTTDKRVEEIDIRSTDGSPTTLRILKKDVELQERALREDNLRDDIKLIIYRSIGDKLEIIKSLTPSHQVGCEVREEITI